jgi:hypothetical protein
MKRPVIALMVVTLTLASAPTLYAQKGPKVKPPSKVTAHAQPVKVKTTQPVKVKTTQPVKVKTTTPVKTSTVKPVKSAKSAKATKPVKTEKLAKAEKPAKVKTSETSTTSTVTLTPVQQKLVKNTNLADKLRLRLPLGTDLMTAAEGFRNLGQFVAAVNVSNNLKIPFNDLKTQMVVEGKSLGESIQTLKKVASVTVEVQRAEYQARGMILESEQAPVTTTAKATKKNTAKPKKTVRTHSGQ